MQVEVKHLTLRRLFLLASRGDVTEVVQHHFDAALSPERIRIGVKTYLVPTSVEQLQQNITWGQRLYLATESENLLDVTLRLFGGWYYSIVSGKAFSEDKALKFGRKALGCYITELLPVAASLFKLVEGLLIQEHSATSGDPDKVWKAAGGDMLNKYGDKLTLDFLASRLSVMYGKPCGHAEVMAAPYLDCLIQLMERRDFAKVEKEYRELSMLAAQANAKK